jgi:hypothetical protein
MIAMNELAERRLDKEARVGIAFVKIGEHWLEESPDDGTLRAVASPTQGSLFVAESAMGGYRFRTCGSARPLLTDNGTPGLGEPAEPGSVFHLPMTEWHVPEGPHAAERAVPETIELAQAGDLVGHRIALGMFWDDKEHKQLVEDAFAAVMRLPDDKPGVSRVKALWSNQDFKTGVFQGLHDADYLAPYINPLSVVPIPTYASHFFDPDSKQNWAPLLFPGVTAYTETLRFAQDAANQAINIANGGRNAARHGALDLGAAHVEEPGSDAVSALPSAPNTPHGRCGYALGLALHYFTDLTQPMHAANFINALWSWDWRHAGFEKGADVRGPRFRIDPNSVTWAQVDPGAMQYIAQLVMNVANKSKKLFNDKVKPVLETKVFVDNTGRSPVVIYDNAPWGSEADPILQEAIPAGQLATTTFLVMWGRMSAFNGSGPAISPRLGPWSAYGPVFFNFRGRTYIVYVDTYLSKNHLYVQPYDNADVPPKKIYTGVTGLPSVVEFDGRLVMAFSKGEKETLQCLTSLDAESWKEEPALANAKIKRDSRPALCVHDGRLIMMWVQSDCGLFWSTRTAWNASWGNPSQMQGKAASHSPTLAIFNGQLFAAWTGRNSKDWVYYARYENGAWSSQENLQPVGGESNAGPALIATDGLLLAFYRRPGDDRICFAKTADGRVWDGGRLWEMPGDYPSGSDLVASPLPDGALVGWSRSHTFGGGYRHSHRLMCTLVGPRRAIVDIPDGSLVRSSDSEKIYVVCGYAKFHIPNEGAFTRMKFKLWDVRRESPDVVNALKSTPTDGKLVKEFSDSKVWYIAGGARFHVQDMQELNQLAPGKKPQFIVIPDGTINQIPEKFQRESMAIKFAEIIGQPVSEIPDRNWMVFNLVRVNGIVKLSPVSTSQMDDETLHQMIATALIAPRSALDTSSVI